jgi:hypothetical protein
MPQTWILPRSSGLAVLGSQVYKEHSLWQNRANRSPATNWDLCPTRILAANLYAATSIRNVIWGVIEPWLQCASRAPGTIRTSAEQVPISRNSKTRPLRRQRDSRAVFRQFNSCPGHVVAQLLPRGRYESSASISRSTVPSGCVGQFTDVGSGSYF